MKLVFIRASMKHFLMLLAMALILSACDTNGGFVTSIPMSGKSAASQKLAADDAMQQAQAAAVKETATVQAADDVRALAAVATAQAVDAAHAQLTITADAQAMLVAQQQAQTTATSQAMFAQQAAQVVEAQATVDARAMLLAQQQAQTTATAQAMQRESVTAEQVASESQQQRELMSWLIPIVAAIAFGLVLLLGAKFIGGMIDSANERRSLENQRLALLGTLFEAPTETIVFADDPQMGFATPQLLSPPDNGQGYDTGQAPMIDIETPPVIVILSSGDKMLADRAEAREEAARCKLAMKVLRDAINHVGAQSNRIPPAAQLGWPARAWTIAVAILRPYGVEILPGSEGGTYLVGQYSTLQALYIAIGERRLTLYPPLAESVING